MHLADQLHDFFDGMPECDQQSAHNRLVASIAHGARNNQSCGEAIKTFLKLEENHARAKAARSAATKPI